MNGTIARTPSPSRQLMESSRTLAPTIRKIEEMIEAIASETNSFDAIHVRGEIGQELGRRESFDEAIGLRGDLRRQAGAQVLRHAFGGVGLHDALQIR